MERRLLPSSSVNTSLPEQARRIRCRVIQMLAAAGSGHSAGSLGMADALTALYFQVLQHRPQEPLWEGRDRLVLSAGHLVPVRYAAMAEAGYFPVSELLSLRQFGSKLQGHPSRTDLPALETSGGPLGQGISQAVGMALAARYLHQEWQTYCIMSDGEHQEGQSWEAIMLAGAKKLGNLTVLVDRNYIQISGPTESVLPLDPLADKYQSFGWLAQEIDGHSIDKIAEAANQARHAQQPVCLILNTVPGRGVSFMEHNYHWHGKAPSAKEAEQALQELGGIDD